MKGAEREKAEGGHEGIAAITHVNQLNLNQLFALCYDMPVFFSPLNAVCKSSNMIHLLSCLIYI